MFSNLRKKYYEWQDKREYEKHIPKEERAARNSNKSDASVKKALIFFFAILVILIVLIVVLFVIKSKSDKAKKAEVTTTIPDTTTIEETFAEQTTFYSSETTTEIQSETTVETVPETTKRKKKIRSTEKNTYIEPEPTYPSSYDPEESEIKIPEPVTKKGYRKIGSRSESNVLSAGKISSIRSSVCANLSGSQNSEYMNLAKYMSANGLSDASSTYRSLTNGDEKNLSTRTCSINIESGSQEDIIIAASKAASKIGSISGNYGIGISSFRKNVGYKIYIVVVY